MQLPVSTHMWSAHCYHSSMKYWVRKPPERTFIKKTKLWVHVESLATWADCPKRCDSHNNISISSLGQNISPWFLNAFSELFPHVERIVKSCYRHPVINMVTSSNFVTTFWYQCIMLDFWIVNLYSDYNCIIYVFCSDTSWSSRGPPYSACSCNSQTTSEDF